MATIKKYKELSKKIRKTILELSFKAKSAHLASCLSSADIVTVIFQSFFNKSKNKFILSKGHAAMLLYAALYHKKIISKQMINSFCKINSHFEEHPSPKINCVDFPTGSLGHGLAAGCGLALGFKLKKVNQKVFVLISDGECNEGAVWESLLFANSKKLNNLIVLIDYNKWQATGRSHEVLSLHSLKKKISSFNLKTFELDGHNHSMIHNIIKKSLSSKKPSVIICNTIKGEGVSFMEDDNNWHYKIPNKSELTAALSELS